MMAGLSGARGQHVVLSLPGVSSGERAGVRTEEADFHAIGLEEAAGLLAEDQDENVAETRHEHAEQPEERRAGLKCVSKLVDLDAPENKQADAEEGEPEE